jgi:RND superfamily putative drug exporter
MVLIGWVVALALLVVAATTVGGEYADDFTFPGTESQRTIDLLGEKFPGPNGETGRVVFETDASINDPAVQETISTFVEEAATLPQVAGMISPYDAPNHISASETVAFVEVQYGETYGSIEESNVEELIALAEAQESASLDVSIIG